MQHSLLSTPMYVNTTCDNSCQYQYQYCCDNTFYCLLHSATFISPWLCITKVNRITVAENTGKMKTVYSGMMLMSKNCRCSCIYFICKTSHSFYSSSNSNVVVETSPVHLTTIVLVSNTANNATLTTLSAAMFIHIRCQLTLIMSVSTTIHIHISATVVKDKFKQC